MTLHDRSFSPGPEPFGVAVGNSGGDFSTTSTSFTDVGFSVNCRAVAGDNLFVCFRGMWKTDVAALTVDFRVVTATGGNSVDVVVYDSPAVSVRTPFILANIYTVVAGDVSNGVVNLKAQYVTGSASHAVVITNSAGVAPVLSAINLGQSP